MATQEEGARIIAAMQGLSGDSAAVMAHLIQANYNDFAVTTQIVIEGHERRIAELEATLSVIRLRVTELFEGDYMPTQWAIERAVFQPDRETVQYLVEQKLGRLRVDRDGGTES